MCLAPCHSVLSNRPATLLPLNGLLFPTYSSDALYSVSTFVSAVKSCVFACCNQATGEEWCETETPRTRFRMRTPLKQEFIKKWTAALNTCCRYSNNICLLEKQKVIQQTASIAIAAAKQGSTAWSRAILADGYDQKILIKATSFRILGIKHKAIRRKSKRRRSLYSMNQNVHKASSSIVKKQTQVLKMLIPGGRAMEECCLIEEALDYIVSLKTQVDVMTELVNAAEYIKKP